MNQLKVPQGSNRDWKREGGKREGEAGRVPAADKMPDIPDESSP